MSGDSRNSAVGERSLVGIEHAVGHFGGAEALGVGQGGFGEAAAEVGVGEQEGDPGGEVAGVVLAEEAVLAVTGNSSRFWMILPEQ